MKGQLVLGMDMPVCMAIRPFVSDLAVTNDRAELSGRLNEKYCNTLNTFITLIY